MSKGRIQYERKAAGKLILKHICMKTVNSYYNVQKNATSAFLKETEEDKLIILVLKEL